VASETFLAQDMVLRQGERKWVEAGSVPGLLDATPAPPCVPRALEPPTDRPAPDDTPSAPRVRKFWMCVVAGVALATSGAQVGDPFGAMRSEAASDGPVENEPAEPLIQRLICSGRVETHDGEVDVTAQIGGQLAEVRVHEGDRVTKGAVLAVLDGSRQEADLAVAENDVRLAQARVARLLAGNGKEEIAQARADADAAEADLVREEQALERSRRLFQTRAVSEEELETRTQRVRQLHSQVEALRKRHEAIRRGSLQGEIDVARAELKLAEARAAKARVERGYALIRAPISGTVIKVYRARGDSVSGQEPAPVVRLADTRDLRVRLEIDEANVALVLPGLEGIIELRGVASHAGRLQVETLVPLFGPRRLFNPDSSAQQDARTLTVLCKVLESSFPLYPGQRVTAQFDLPEGRSKAPASDGASAPPR
jgi:multidrug efflux pump subunit AcrA (membrane-fusion protein)